jgi:hypothetical protein
MSPPPPETKFKGDHDTVATMEESNDTLASSEAAAPILNMTHVIRKEEDQQIRVYEVTEFHECIASRNWQQLEKLLKKYNDRYYKRKREQANRRKEKLQTQQEQGESAQDSQSTMSPPKSPGGSDSSIGLTARSPSRISMSVLKLLPQSMRSLNSEQQEIVSPLLKLDEAGRTPLHLALFYECPETLLVDLMKKDLLALSQPDDAGQLPLHVAMIHRQHYHMLEKLIKAQPNALKTKDIQSRTPIGFAVELARTAQEEVSDKANIEDPANPFHWGTPLSDTEKAWQFDQMAIWTKVEFLLRDLMRRKKNLIPSEHGLLVEALEAGAPAKVINRFISTTDKYLAGDDDFAGSAVALCVERQYSLDTLEYLAGRCRDGTTIITDYTQKALSHHYRRGCQPISPEMPAFGKEIIDWCKHNGGSSDEKKEEDGDAEGFLSGASKQCREWWSILRFLLFFSAYGKDFSKKGTKILDMHIVHAALAVPATPPSLIQLLLVIFPEARAELCPTFKALPVHLACTRWRYDVLRNDKDSSLEKVLKMFLKTDKEQLVSRYRGRLPLHMALTVGQSWSFVKPFVSLDKKSVGMRDPHTKLFPFQLAAIKISSKNLAMLLRNRYTPSEWRTTPQSEKMLEVAKARDTQDRRQIGTIYELLRRYPDAIANTYMVRDSVKTTAIVKGAGLISSHYLAWTYHLGANGWRLNPSNAKPLRDSIVNGFIAKPLAVWWDQLREYIWETTPSVAMPESDDFLLHAALYNCDTPPTIIELLLALFPMAAAQPLPGTQIYPLHIAAGTSIYHPQPFEVPYSMDNMQLTLNAYKGAVGLTVNGQLPIHMCLSRGKTWKEIRPLVKQERKTLLVEDSVSKLPPFQLMATFRITSANNVLRFAAIAEKQTRNIEMEELSVVERAKTLRDVKRNFDLDVLSTVYELLRHAPAAMSQRIISSGASDVASTVSSVSNDDIDFKSAVAGNMAMLDHYLRTVQETPALGPKKSLSTYLERAAPNGARGSLMSHSPRPSLSNFLGRGMPSRESSQRSLISRTSGAVYDDYVKPVYDDDIMSSMGASVTSSVFSSPVPQQSTSTTPNSSVRRSARRGTRIKNRMPNLPDLNLDE